jgi:hypothetical protein
LSYDSKSPKRVKLDPATYYDDQRPENAQRPENEAPPKVKKIYIAKKIQTRRISELKKMNPTLSARKLAKKNLLYPDAKGKALNCKIFFAQDLPTLFGIYRICQFTAEVFRDLSNSRRHDRKEPKEQFLHTR